MGEGSCWKTSTCARWGTAAHQKRSKGKKGGEFGGMNGVMASLEQKYGKFFDSKVVGGMLIFNKQRVT